jgi:hypothetical protein
LFELHYTIFNQTKISEWQNYFAPYSRIGGLPFILIVTSFVALLFQKQYNDPKSFLNVKKHKLLFILFALLGLLSIFFSSSISSPLWHVLPVTFIQFPFRFLSLEIVACAFLAAYLFSALQSRIIKGIFATVVVISLTINAVPYFINISSFDKGEGFYTTNQSTTTTRDEYMPVWVKEKPLERAAEKVQVIKGTADVTNSIFTNTKISFTANVKSNAGIQVNKVYWPGWTASVDGKDAAIDYRNSKGVMTIAVPTGSHQVRLSFQETPLRLFADLITIISFVALTVFIFYNDRKIIGKSNKK